MADKISFCDYFKIPKEKISDRPDELDGPKQSLIQAIRKYCKNKDHRESIVPQAASLAVTGPAYNSALIQFIDKRWARAKQLSQPKTMPIGSKKVFQKQLSGAG